MRSPARLWLCGAVLALGTLGAAFAAHAQDEAPLPHQHWSFSGPFGTFDRAAAQRGFQVYREVCSSCHSLNEAYYRDLAGIGLSEAQIKAIAASVSVPTIGDDGQPAERPATPADHFRKPFANDKAARAALGGALPPDLSVIVKAREGGADYVYGILTGFTEPPPGMTLAEGMHYNKVFPGHQIAMPPPLQDGQVTYADGTRATIAQEAHDVVTFLAYVANPEMEARKRTGVKIILFLLVLTGLVIAVKRKVWSRVH
jgi:ubiquinol-cytochrome c reductase cytochrome c1 subunit